MVDLEIIGEVVDRWTVLLINQEPFAYLPACSVHKKRHVMEKLRTLSGHDEEVGCEYME